MVDKLKKQFIPVDYELDLFKKMQGLKQVGKSVQEYIEEFYRLLIRPGQAEENKEKVAHYLSGLRPSIQEELNLVRMTNIEEAYQFSLRVEEKLNKKFEGRQRGHGQGERGSSRSSGSRYETQKKNEDVGTRRYQRNEGFNHSRDQNFVD